MHRKPIISLDDPAWPEELRAERDRLSRKVQRRGSMLVIGAVLVASVIIMIVLANAPTGPLQTMFAKVPNIVYYITTFALVSWWASMRQSRPNLEAAMVLLRHGYCPCGYKPLEHRGELACPECGRHWVPGGVPSE